MSFLRKIALIYDPWSLGLSDGLPRNEIYPSKQAEDYSDALSYLSSLPMVDSSSIAFWRMSFSATVALCAAALDKRASLIIAVCPFLNFELTPAKFPKVLVKCQNTAGMGIGATKEGFDQIVNANSRAPNYEKHTNCKAVLKL
uniref:Uncharacterized protein n=1 Tax=Cladonia uncialis subsp. uncialis TaxID=180999 RepID=A0A1Z1C4U0_CLAUC|nr:hypothetical protein [Cladonia uncialis subsp. uncialis]